ncbi:MAG: hypothetical protein HYX48_05705 [Chlamydiales bacterium]|nr:hypothetical protein [Chlamydiales bacterium]
MTSRTNSPTNRPAFNVLAERLAAQVRESEKENQIQFAYLEKQLGADLLKSIPTVNVQLNEGEDPCPWKSAKELPADVVKGVSSGRAYLALRYATMDRNYALAFIYQKFPKSTPHRVETALGARGGVTLYVQVGITVAHKVSTWIATHRFAGEYPICNEGKILTEKEFALVKGIILGASESETGGRYQLVVEQTKVADGDDKEEHKGASS